MQLPTNMSSASSIPSASTAPQTPQLLHPVQSRSRPPLPHRPVQEDTIEDAYVQFILCCNPAVPPETDPTALKEAFRVPPKSEGKTFSTFTLFILIGKLMQKDEVKTWGDLALRLGVDPPNQEKNQSTQKIQQYAVRLKRWMKSMHIDAFFDYLYENPHAYWTQIPPEGTPILEIARDGVAPEDDMALRALLPHIRPRRGRRTREDEEASRMSSSKMARIDSPVGSESTASNCRTESFDPWVAHAADGRNAHQGLATPPPNHPWAGDLSQQFTTHPQSAITPTTRTDYWGEEPRSAITPNKANRGHKRHGPKVVSSAWRSGQASSGKTRGRPPINRASNDGPFSAYPGDGAPLSAFRPSPPEMTTPVAMSTTATMGWGGGSNSMAVADVLTQPQPQPPSQPQSQPPTQHLAQPPYPTPPALPSLNAALSFHEQQPPPAQGERLSKPRGLSLQVPERVSGEVRLATPPPVVMVNGHAVPITNAPEPTPPQPAEQLSDEPRRESVSTPRARSKTPETVTHTECSPRNDPGEGVPPPPPPLEPSKSIPEGQNPPSQRKVFFRDPSVRTNIDALEGFFMHEIMTGNWVDKDGKTIPRGGADEAYAIVSKVIESLQNEATNENGFLLNVSALAGGKLLMTTTSLKITVAKVLEDRTEYFCEWQLQLGDCKGVYKMSESVEHSKWKTPRADSERLRRRKDAEIAAMALAVKSSLPPPGQVSSSYGGSNSTSNIANIDTSIDTSASSSNRNPIPYTNPAAGESTNSGNYLAGRPIADRTGIGGRSDEESVEYWKEKCRELAEMLQKQKSPEQSEAEIWRERYAELAELYRRKDEEVARIQSRVMEALRDPRIDRTW